METDRVSPAVETNELSLSPAAIYTDIRDYYSVAGPDYETWSPDFNMHFGYYRRFRDIFSLERMLVNMNDEVLAQLELDRKKEAIIADLGCGMATVARHVVKRFPFAKVTALTIVGYQVEKARQLNEEQGLTGRITVLGENFEDLSIPAETFTHAYAIESACHAASPSKQLFIAEMARVLKQGGRFCIADGFLKNNRKKPRLFQWLYKKMMNYWAVPGFACITDFEEELKAHGLQHIHVREISYRIAPSVLYVPLKCLQFFFTELWKNRSLRMKKERWHNVYAPLLGMFIGLYRKHFGYYLVSGEK